MSMNKVQVGISLIELVLFIVIVSATLAGTLLVMDTTEKGSVNPLIHKQTLAIAEALLEEIELQNFSNPIGGFTGAAIQANRASFDDILDYNGFTTVGVYPADGSATPVTGLTAYNVSVVVTTPLTAAWGSVPADQAAQIVVTVTAPNGETLNALGYRIAY